MKYSNKELKMIIKSNRETLMPNWEDLDYGETDKGRKLPKPTVFKSYENAKVFELIKDIPSLSNKKIDEIILTRRSVRQYEDQPMSLLELSYLCKLTSKIVKMGPGYAMGVIPTGGATNSLETYLYLNKIVGFKKGLYHYMKDTGNLQLIRDDVTDELVNDAMKNQLRNCAAVFFWTTTPYRAEYKYSFTSHKMIAIEAGHACQNLYLAAESIDYGVVGIAAYNQKLVDELLQIENDEFVIYIATVGKKIKQ
ncbi:MAG: SagB/ThcOx family dehydrogenase [Tenericutes bacterium]|nr:SagB/ThcOx family dehydrogenase [Mycoplasmatota bacterium]